MQVIVKLQIVSLQGIYHQLQQVVLVYLEGLQERVTILILLIVILRVIFHLKVEILLIRILVVSLVMVAIVV